MFYSISTFLTSGIHFPPGNVFRCVDYDSKVCHSVKWSFECDFSPACEESLLLIGITHG